MPLLPSRFLRRLFSYSMRLALLNFSLAMNMGPQFCAVQHLDKLWGKHLPLRAVVLHVDFARVQSKRPSFVMCNGKSFSKTRFSHTARIRTCHFPMLSPISHWHGCQGALLSSICCFFCKAKGDVSRDGFLQHLVFGGRGRDNTVQRLADLGSFLVGGLVISNQCYNLSEWHLSSLMPIWPVRNYVSPSWNWI